MNSPMTCLRACLCIARRQATLRQMVAPDMMIPALCQIKPFLISFPYPGDGDGLAIPHPHFHEDMFAWGQVFINSF
ncbi:MAG TPA: hypothetical protein ACFYD4_09660 [Candidatus Wunengus sp. YC61]|uniref:hypothetical protein n=1 Tax=Candidatus Wunengus sp. YC61 TaxID=3367698 RepID=UPI0040252752